MKRALSVLLLSAFLCTRAEAGELFKIRALFEHFFEHHATDTQISFVDFLYMHYIGSDNNSNDEDQDARLPFKSTPLALNVFDTVLQQLTAELDAPGHVCFDKKHALPYTVFLSEKPSGNIWQPPRTA